MIKALVTLHPQERLGAVDPYIYGQYFEHLGNCIYPAVSDHGSPLADERGLRRDVVEAARELDVPVIRWPGGCFVDLYDWKDGVGPREQRPVRYNWHWGGLESNQFGTDEFLHWCEQAGAEPYINVNLGTGTLIDSLRWIDYCNGRETADAAWRKANGRDEPYNVKLWGIGNETWGHWEAGQLSASDYAGRLANWAQFAKKYDSSLQLLGVGSYEGKDHDWDRKVLEAAAGYLHYLTVHIYGCSIDRESTDEYYPIVFTPVYFEQRMREMRQTVADTLRDSKMQLKQPIRLSLDEWNIRHYEPDPQRGEGAYRLNRNSPRNLQDALFVAGVLNAMIRLSPDVGMANYVFLVNGNGVMNVTEDGVVKTPLYYVFQQYRKWMVGEHVRLDIQSPAMMTPAPKVSNPEYTKELALAHRPVQAPLLDAVAVIPEEGGLHISLTNRHLTEGAEIALELPAGMKIAQQWTLTHDDIHAANTPASPDTVVPVWAEHKGGAAVSVPPHSLVLLKCENS
ncbi:alpha-N-arabinofuranosidase [Paenibacillus sp. UNCCL117]|uniref:alpha-L-arabinofuranosidase C-terminal domain-containing protein n=1 Tax=unclassified Paenibacillus TaxID=185978 RepID=UPI000885BFA3|nr:MULTISPECIES: alpha-L-arabinofuranosidase C-terminal domain-containing protein [unclassified Paenibacillus]SDD69387.1 alpha-L-arabinofuranosidase [Paenibacillus sp. cl123]SFW45130.1 alpha-N-arabinofuranosidase [Paenibacillus sp. UNCCL117]